MERSDSTFTRTWLAVPGALAVIVCLGVVLVGDFQELRQEQPQLRLRSGFDASLRLRHGANASVLAGCSGVQPPGQPELFCELKRRTRIVGIDVPRGVGPTCALVGSGARLLQYRDGEDIDAHDTVWHLNHAPASSPWSPFVGSREGIRFMGGLDPSSQQMEWVLRETASSEAGHGRAVVVLCALCSPDAAAQLQSQLDPAGVKVQFLGLSRVPWTNLSDILAEVFPKAVPEDVDKPKHRISFPTTGGMAVIAALSLCERVDAYGLHNPRVAYGTLGDRYFDLPSRTNIWYCMLVDFVTIVAPFVKTHPCSNEDAHRVHALRPAEHELFELISWTDRNQLLQTGMMSLPGFACVDCSGVASAKPSEVVLDPGTPVPWQPPSPLFGRVQFQNRIVVDFQRKRVLSWSIVAAAIVSAALCCALVRQTSHPEGSCIHKPSRSVST